LSIAQVAKISPLLNSTDVGSHRPELPSAIRRKEKQLRQGLYMGKRNRSAVNLGSAKVRKCTTPQRARGVEGADERFPKGVTPECFYRGSILIRLDSRLKHAGMTDFGNTISLTQQAAGNRPTEIESVFVVRFSR